MKWLLARKSWTPNGFSAFGATDLGWLCHNPEADLACVQMLLDAGYSLNLKEKPPNLRLWKAVSLTKGVGSKIGFNAQRVMATYVFQGTPLHRAAQTGNLPLARELIRLGADPTIKDGYGLTPLERAHKVHPNCCTPEQLKVIFEEGPAGAADTNGGAPKPKKPAFFSMHSYAKIQPNLIPRDVETPRLDGVAPVGA